MLSLIVPAKRKKSISLTALIDVVFILLMFFMLTSSFTQFGAVKMNTSLSTHTAAKLEPQIFHLDIEGGLRTGASEVRLSDEALKKLILKVQVKLEVPTLLLPAANTSVQKVVDALGRMKALGFTHVTLGRLEGGVNNKDKERGI